MNVNIINPFILSVSRAFSTMLGAEATRGAIALSDGGAGDGDIVAFIGVAGKTRGTVALSFPAKTALRTVSRLLGSECKIMDESVADAVGELVNIIAGSAKAELAGDSGEPLSLSLPTVVRGHQYKIRYAHNARWVEVPFECEFGPFALKVILESDSPSA
jgi:chemotaxis protein CheX